MSEENLKKKEKGGFMRKLADGIISDYGAKFEAEARKEAEKFQQWLSENFLRIRQEIALVYQEVEAVKKELQELKNAKSGTNTASSSDDAKST
jgi:hypothetical protein